MKYVCNSCGEAFDDPEEWEDSHGLDSPPYEKIIVSPCCHDGYSIATECADCGKDISIHNKYGLCEECKTKALKQFVYYLNNELTERDREYIDDCIMLVGIIDPEKIKGE